MKIGNQEFSDKCPTKCPGFKKTFSQGGLCQRCPIFNCKQIIGEDRTFFALIEPKDYRKDWALIWKQWFKGSMDCYPELPLQKHFIKS